jgi:hypothetical protein
MLIWYALQWLAQALFAAAKGGKWKPEFSLVSSLLSPWAWEMLLLVPAPFVSVLLWAVGMLPPEHVISPGQADLSEGRQTSAEWQLEEIIKVTNIDLIALSQLAPVGFNTHASEAHR